MGWKTVARLIDDNLLAGYTPAQALVLIVLAHHEGTDGAYPSERRLAAIAHCSRNTVRGALGLAEKRALIAPYASHRRTTKYRFTGSTTEPVGSSDWLNPRQQLAQPTTATGSLCLARNGTGTESVGNHARKRATTNTDSDGREPWQVAKDSAVAAELERTRPRTADELAEIERKRAWQDELDRRETERRDFELEASSRAL